MISTSTKNRIAGTALGIAGTAVGFLLGFVLTSIFVPPQDKSSNKAFPSAKSKRRSRKSKVKLEEVIEESELADDDDSDSDSAPTENLADHARRTESEYVPKRSPVNFGSMQTKGIRSVKGDIWDIGVGDSASFQ
ncbi:hypothetical protein DE146DRAFT_731698 [Phaeosphaeria sp. MPI-PUGE-AT-0046c]|nr:hypothetical protein DE146DRAFT_731698 [Phaeosphaeria sp. MPI-PUGE-AT-0046c]